MFTSLQSNGLSLDLSVPCVMGIVNLNKDSFFAGSRHNDIALITRYIETNLQNGMDIIDLGALSSRPGAKTYGEKEERKRLIPILKSVRKEFPNIFISIDTYRSAIALESYELGANMINDISGGSLDNTLFELVSQHNIPYVIMHMQGLPGTMQKDPKYNNVVFEILQFLIKLKRKLNDMGAYQLMVDPGFGFGKTIEDNYTLLSKLSAYSILDLPILVGLSRKSMIYKVLESDAESALNGTTALHMVALTNGANILRVHDVHEARETIKLYNALKKSSN